MIFNAIMLSKGPRIEPCNMPDNIDRISDKKINIPIIVQFYNNSSYRHISQQFISFGNYVQQTKK